MNRYFLTSSNRFQFRSFLHHQNGPNLFLSFSSTSSATEPGTEPTGSWKNVEGVMRCSANYAPLTPLSFLDRSAKVFPDRTALVYSGSTGHVMKQTWKLTRQRCLKLASTLTNFLGRGDVVAVLAPNVPAIYELHFAVPMAGAVLCCLNSRLNSATIFSLLAHSQAKILFIDHELAETAEEALTLLANSKEKLPLLVLINDSDTTPTRLLTSIHHKYEDFIANGDCSFQVICPIDEWDPITLNYTSGTTSRPKGVVYSHRGAYLNAISTFLLHDMGMLPTYLWSVPMFHCSGWCLPWGVAAQGGTNVCLRKVTPKAIFDHIALHGVTHLGAAPTVLNMIVNAPAKDMKPLPHKVRVCTGGSPPPPQVLLKMEDLGFEVTHLYGLTETYGPGTYCVWKPEWDSLPPTERARMKARQGVQHLGLEDVDVRDPVTMESVPADGKTTGEIMFKGNTVMSGYLKDVNATKEAFRGGWFHTGDQGVKHPDEYIEIKDRLKDVIISGGENISTVEVETVLYSHPAILEVAVVARPDNHWGETPCAFVKLKDRQDANEKEIIDFCRDRLPHYMAPKTVIFQEIPKTATGKIQKFILREKAKALGSLF